MPTFESDARTGTGASVGGFAFNVGLGAISGPVGGAVSRAVGRTIVSPLLRSGKPYILGVGIFLRTADNSVFNQSLGQAVAMGLRQGSARSVGKAIVTPASLGARSITQNGRLHGMWEESMREIFAARNGGGAFRTYLDIIESGAIPTARQARLAYKSIRSSFSRKVNAAIESGELFPGYSFQQIHHWNWHLADHSLHALDPRQLFPVTGILHRTIHLRTTVGPVIRPLDMYFKPIDPLQRLSLDMSYPLAPGRTF